MDETLRELERFSRGLTTFIDTLKQSDRELRLIEDKLKGTWDDSFEKEFNKRYDELANPVRRFTTRESVSYQQFITRKIQQLRKYLGHA